MLGGPVCELDMGKQGNITGFTSPLSFILGAAREEIGAFVERLVCHTRGDRKCGGAESLQKRGSRMGVFALLLKSCLVQTPLEV